MDFNSILFRFPEHRLGDFFSKRSLNKASLGSLQLGVGVVSFSRGSPSRVTVAVEDLAVASAGDDGAGDLDANNARRRVVRVACSSY